MARKKLTGKIEDDTPILPWVVSDAVAREVWQLLHEKGFDHAGSMVHGLSEYLGARASRHYATNDSWAKKIRSQKDDGRRGLDTLYAYMRHWASAWVKSAFGQRQFDALPHKYPNGVLPRTTCAGTTEAS